jgi:hypothetical protein
MWKAIFTTTVIAGTLDTSAASLSAYLRSGTTPDRVLRFVASGVFGQQALTGSNLMLVWGMIFHYTIALACTTCFFLAYAKWKLFVSNPRINAVMVGIVAWIVTEFDDSYSSIRIVGGEPITVRSESDIYHMNPISLTFTVRIHRLVGQNCQSY